ncbi:BQ5605_C011g06533 [Microbotryum silenes-dioicae]|uniref:BQ5605_C011g06533 protein n=1 Tax=Microbotryum silenes-dioicae TaxID=796604 RepID=A0A2X0LPD3_9BASI|nr:BQ5605_C011g06533 [Microbotryum silenes-dioicae]
MMKDHSCLRTLLSMGMFGAGDLMVRPTGHVHGRPGLDLTSPAWMLLLPSLGYPPLFKPTGPHGLPDSPCGASSPLLCTVLPSQRAGLLLSTHSRPLPFRS